ncbi:4'-phosphopantetheinyl transferase [Gorgonomyces haynaldii]|nr:4'-phosphopantetheinyl transferase [Gorgonomyces haynaldii]
MHKLLKHGVDIIAMERIERLYTKQPVKFPQRILSTQEQAEFMHTKDKCRYLATRWAIKEAIFKTMWPERVEFKDLTIEKRNSKPYLKNYQDCAISWSHDAGIVMASCIMWSS